MIFQDLATQLNRYPSIPFRFVAANENPLAAKTTVRVKSHTQWVGNIEIEVSVRPLNTYYVELVFQPLTGKSHHEWITYEPNLPARCLPFLLTRLNLERNNTMYSLEKALKLWPVKDVKARQR